MADKNLEFRDKMGHVLKRGDIVAYGVAYGYSCGLSLGVVLETTQSKSEFATKKAKLRVWGVDTGWNDKPGANTKSSLLEYSERVIRIDRSSVSEDFLKKLDKALADYEAKE